MIARPPRQRRDFFFQLLDQPMPMRGDNIHDSLLAKERLKSSYPDALIIENPRSWK